MGVVKVNSGGEGDLPERVCAGLMMSLASSREGTAGKGGRGGQGCLADSIGLNRGEDTRRGAGLKESTLQGDLGEDLMIGSEGAMINDGASKAGIGGRGGGGDPDLVEFFDQERTKRAVVDVEVGRGGEGLDLKGTALVMGPGVVGGVGESISGAAKREKREGGDGEDQATDGVGGEERMWRG